MTARHPRLYWNRDCTLEREWFRFLHSVPTDRTWRSKGDGHGGKIRTLDVLVPADQVWTAKSDSVSIPKWLGIPGIRHTVGPPLWWHFSINLLWVLNGAAFYGMLFATGQWLRLVPTTWTVFPNALSMLIQYWSLHFPVDSSWTNYNALQHSPISYGIHRRASSDRHRLDAEPGSALPLIHGAPLRLRCENELGFKLVKWRQAIEFVHSLAPAKAATTRTTSSMGTACLDLRDARSERGTCRANRDVTRQPSRPQVLAETKIKAENSNERSASYNAFRSRIG